MNNHILNKKVSVVQYDINVCQENESINTSRE